MSLIFTRQPAKELSGFEVTFVDRDSPDPVQAEKQHQAYGELLASLGHEVKVLPTADHLPDSIFVEDVAVLFPEVSVLTRPGAISRQPEVALIEQELQALGNVARIEAPATLEGGDVLRVDKLVFVGLTTRTNQAGIEQLAAILSEYGYTVIPVEVTGCLHLKTGITALDDETVLVNPAWLDVSAFAGFTHIMAEPDEPWAANVLRLGQQIVMNAASQKTQAKVRAAGFDVHSADISEFMKMEAGLTCMSLVVPR
ncbi:dimethylarginine dimethylaminohydrolase family protein [Leeia oryzae]|uniref:dimethylarginine dimethylaminohydrolase family protein n=1 Tax=Leeia oryzae TaxID=356662 RepID=UPI00037040BE|nr:arginine deiminase family protein [Leeia oryzae]